MYNLIVEPSEDEIEVEEEQTILDACLRQGIYIPHACGHGLCGTCKVDVIDGEVDHGEASPFALMDFEREDGKTLACCARMMSDVTIEADVEENPDARKIAVEDFSGTVAAVNSVTPTVKEILVKLDGDMIDFQAGQYVNVVLPGIEGSRAFSLANGPREDLVRLQVKLVEGGQGTSYIHNELKEGDRFEFSGPYGRFIVRKSHNTPVIFFAAGTGVSSPRSMILDLLEEDYPQSITLFYGARNCEELYGHDEFLKLASEYENFDYIPVLSREEEGSDWEGARGHVQDAAKAKYGDDFSGNTAYLCGPPAMVEDCIKTLMMGRLFEKSIFTEKFLTAKDGTEKPKSPVFKRL